MAGRAGRVVGIEHGLDGTLTGEGSRNGGCDALARHVCEFLIHEQRGVSFAFADETGVEPLPRDSLEFPEQVQLGFFAGIAPFGEDEPFREVKEQGRSSQIGEVLQIQVHAFADDTGVARDGRSYKIGGQLHDGIGSESRGQLF